MFQEKAHQTAQHKEKEEKNTLQTNMKQHWILSVPLVFHICNKVNQATR